MADVVIHMLSGAGTRGRVLIGGLSFACAVGRSGLAHIKREGDGRTPIGSWRIERFFWRQDRGCRPGRLLRFLAGRPLRPGDGWCDAAADANYNRYVRHPYETSAERLWRNDELYDFIVVLGYNRYPRIRGRGSAIFLHVAREEPGGALAATEGCVALRRRDLEIVLTHLRRDSRVRVGR